MLLARHRPTDEAGLAGYLLAIADRNGLPFSFWATAIGISPRPFLNPSDVMYGRVDVSAFAAGLQLESSALSNKVYACDRQLKRPADVVIRNFGDVPYVLMRGIHSPICPLCLDDRRFPERNWDFVLHTRCGRHNVRLIDHCPQCDERITWARTELNRCRCGCVLSKIDAPSDLDSPASLSRDEMFKIALLVAFELAEQKGELQLDDLRERRIDVLAPKLARALSAIRAGELAVKQWLNKILRRRADINGSLGRRWLKLPAMLAAKKYPEWRNWFMPLIESCGDDFALTETLSVTDLSLSESCELLALSPHIVKRLCRTQQLVVSSKPRGKKSLRISAESIVRFMKAGVTDAVSVPIVTQASSKLSVEQVAKQLNIYPDAIRRVIKLGLMSSKKGKGTQVVVEPAQVVAFQKDYVFIRELAKYWKVNATNLAEKLKFLGITPVSGPNVDGGLVYVFHRADISPETEASVNSVTQYTTRTGRRKGTSLHELCESHLTINQVAYELATTPLKVASLISQKYLATSQPDGIFHNRHYVHRDEVNRYLASYRLNPNWLTDTIAAQQLNITRHQLQRRHIDAGELTSATDGLHHYVRKSDVEKLMRDSTHLLCVADAAKLLCRPRHVMINLLKTNQITAAKGPTVDGTKRYYFRKTDVEQFIVRPG